MSSTRFAHAIQANGAAPKAGGTRGPTRTYAARTLANISAHIRARRSFSPEFPSDIAPTQLGREGSYKQPPKPPRHGISAGLLWLTACIAGDQPTSPLARQARRITGRKTAEQSAIHAHILRRSLSPSFFFSLGWLAQVATRASPTPHSPTSHPSQHRTERGPEPHTAHHLVVAMGALRLVEVRAVRTARIPREAPSPSRLLPVEPLLRPPPTTLRRPPARETKLFFHIVARWILAPAPRAFGGARCAAAPSSLEAKVGRRASLAAGYSADKKAQGRPGFGLLRANALTSDSGRF